VFSHLSIAHLFHLFRIRQDNSLVVPIPPTLFLALLIALFFAAGICLFATIKCAER